MISRTTIFVIVLLAVSLFLFILFISGETVKLSWIRFVSVIPAVIAALFVVFERWAWRWPYINPWIVHKPYIGGTWKGEIRSNWTPNGSTIPPITAYLDVKQTYSTLHLHLMTNESSSDLLAGKIHNQGGGNYIVAGIYRNTPEIFDRPNSPIHHGGIILYIQRDITITLKGEYFTDRNTKGSLKFNGRDNQHHQSIESASRAEYEGMQ